MTGKSVKCFVCGNRVFVTKPHIRMTTDWGTRFFHSGCYKPGMEDEPAYDENGLEIRNYSRDDGLVVKEHRHPGRDWWHRANIEHRYTEGKQEELYYGADNCFHCGAYGARWVSGELVFCNQCVEDRKDRR